MKRFATVLGVSVLVLAVLPLLVQATQVQYRSPQQLGGEASLVVRGTVERIHSYWNETRTKIFTETLVQIDETYKGLSRSQVRVVQLGGVVGNVRMTVHGALSWRPGEEVLLFLETYDPRTYQVSGFCQGKFVVERDASGKPFVKAPVVDNGRILNLPEGEMPETPHRVERVSLNRFVTQALGLR